LAKYSEFYKGSRKKRNYAIIPFIVVLFIISLITVAFYGMQKYAVIEKDGIAVELPILSDGEDTAIDGDGNVVRVFEAVDAQLEFGEADYSSVEAVAGKYMQEMRAIFVPAENLTQEKLDAYLARLNLGNALVLEMKPRTGNLMWISNAELAVNYGMSAQPEQDAMIRNFINTVKAGDKQVYLTAQISCCIDELLASRCTDVALRTSYGANYVDENGTWLDPYNTNVRNYVIQMARELFDMGFDEVVLADVSHPVMPYVEGQESAGFSYTREMSTTPGPVNAVCGFALYVSKQLADRSDNDKLSIYCTKAQALVRPEAETGQDAVLFMKLYDRVYYYTDGSAYPYNVSDIESNVTIGNVYDRLVPVVNYLFDNSSWVLVDPPEAEE